MGSVSGGIVISEETPVDVESSEASKTDYVLSKSEESCFVTEDVEFEEQSDQAAVEITAPGAIELSEVTPAEVSPEVSETVDVSDDIKDTEEGVIMESEESCTMTDDIMFLEQSEEAVAEVNVSEVLEIPENTPTTRSSSEPSEKEDVSDDIMTTEEDVD